MPKITPGNRLYLYRLLSQALGVGRQTLMPRVEEALVEDGLQPEDLGCETMRELCEQLPEFIKLTVFKKGYVYATVLANEEYDRALERSEAGTADKAAASGKPWKRKRGAKALKPVRPRHVERAPEPEPEVAVAEPEPEAAVPEPEPEVLGDSGHSDEKNRPDEPKTEDAAEVLGEPGRSTGEDRPDEPKTAAEPEAEPEPTPVPEPEHVPPITFTITYVPEPEPEPEPDFSPEPAPEPDAAAGTQAETPASPEPEEPVAPIAAVSARAQSDLPRDFHADVRCSSEQLSTLSQVLPADVDPMATLEEDFRVARSSGALEGTRSNVTFSLRYLQADGRTPVRVTLRRSARAVAGKRWALTEVDAGATDEVGLEGLDVARRGSWGAFQTGDSQADPERAFAQTISLGSRDEALERLAGLARPEEWGEGRRILSDYLVMTFARVTAEGKLVVADGGPSARFDTGLVTPEGSPIGAELSAGTGDIPWQLEGFSTTDPVDPVRYVTSLAQMTLDPALPAPPFSSREEVVRNPRLATPAYDPVANEVRLLVPHDGRALALAATESGYEAVATLELADAYACARVISSDLPAWLATAVRS